MAIRKPKPRKAPRPACGGAGGGSLLVGRVAVLPDDALDESAQVGADVLAQGPVNGDVGLGRS